MNRRELFRTLIGGVAAAAAVRTWPFRVYSFPTEIAAPEDFDLSEWEEKLTRFWSIQGGPKKYSPMQFGLADLNSLEPADLAELRTEFFLGDKSKDLFKVSG
jgi:hypothetical protein